MPGVIVVVAWPLFEGPLGHRAGYLKLMETVTDKNGDFRVPGWGRAEPPQGTDLVRYAPEITLFHTGYVVEVRVNDRHHPAGSPRTDPLSSDWHEHTIELKPVRGLTDPYGVHLSNLADYYEDDTDPCIWMGLPRLTAEVVKLAAELERLNISSSLPGAEELHDHKQWCVAKHAEQGE